MLSNDQRTKLEQLLSNGETEQVRQQLSTIESGSEADPNFWVVKAKLAIREGEHVIADDLLQKGLEHSPGHRELLFQRAYNADLSGSDVLARELYEECLKEPPLHVNALVNLAVLYEDVGRYEDAELCLEQVLNHHPNHARARLFLRDVHSSKTMFYDEDKERDREKRNAILDIPISDFELSVRSRNCLKKMNIATLGDLLRTTEAELLSYKNFGETSLNEIKAMLTQKGLRLGQALEDNTTEQNTEQAYQPALPPDVDPSVLQKPVSELEFSVRSRKCLQRLGILNLGDLASKTEAELLGSKNFGQTSLAEVRLRLAEHGLGLRPIEGRAPRM